MTQPQAQPTAWAWVVSTTPSPTQPGIDLLTVACPHCREQHRHSAPNDAGPDYGPRPAPCTQRAYRVAAPQTELRPQSIDDHGTHHRPGCEMRSTTEERTTPGSYVARCDDCGATQLRKDTP